MWKISTYEIRIDFRKKIETLKTILFFKLLFVEVTERLVFLEKSYHKVSPAGVTLFVVPPAVKSTKGDPSPIPGMLPLTLSNLHAPAA